MLRKIIKKLLVLSLTLVSLCIICCVNTSANTISYNTFETIELSQEEQDECIKDIKMRKVYKEERYGTPYVLAVSTNNRVALGFSSKGVINIYDGDGNYLHTLLMADSFSKAYSLEWDGDYLILIKMGSYKHIFVIDMDEMVVEVRKIPYTGEYRSYTDSLIGQAPNGVYNGATYELRNNIFGPLKYLPGIYTQLIKTDQQGDVSVIYDVTLGVQTRDYVYGSILICGMVFLFKRTYKHYKETGHIKPWYD